MDPMGAMAGGILLVLAWVWLKWRRQTQLDKMLARRVAASEIVGRKKERLGYDDARDVQIGDIIRELRPVRAKVRSRAA